MIKIGGTMDSSKPLYLSRTLWINLIMAVAAFIPGVGVWIAAHPDLFAGAFSVINIVLRLITKDKLSIG